ncbi:hypothetical protein ISS22_03070 [candidate division KSB1 bacterium]|nr:hypothetical protein [candidate division KSB1 bacterium]
MKILVKNARLSSKEKKQNILLDQRFIALLIQQNLFVILNSTQNLVWYILLFHTNFFDQLLVNSLNPGEHDEENWDENDLDDEDEWEDDDDLEDDDLDWEPDDDELDDEDEWDEDDGIDMEDEEEWN